MGLGARSTAKKVEIIFIFFERTAYDLRCSNGKPQVSEIVKL